MADTTTLVKDCISMFERYYEQARTLPNDNSKVFTLNGADLKAWKDTFYPQLSKPEIIQDAGFFQSPVKNANYGVGMDGSFCKVEYVQFLYRAYKYLKPNFDANSGTRYIKQCVDMLEPYVTRFANKGTGDDVVITLSNSELELWKKGYYLFFCKSALLKDGEFFGDITKNANFGIGADGAFTGKELLHFLYQCYKLVYTHTDTPVWKILFLNCKKIKGNVGSATTAEDNTDIRRVAERFGNFVYAFSGGNVALAIDYREIEREVALTKSSDSSYFIAYDAVNEELCSFAYGKKADAVISYTRYGKNPTDNWSGLTFYTADRSGKPVLLNDIGFSTVKLFEGIPNSEYIQPVIDKPPLYIPHPEEVVVHEFCHVLEVFYESKGYGNLPNPDDAFTYGYQNENLEGRIAAFFKFYGDILSAKVMDPDKKTRIGVTPEMWKHSPIKDLAQGVHTAAAPKFVVSKS